MGRLGGFVGRRLGFVGRLGGFVGRRLGCVGRRCDTGAVWADVWAVWFSHAFQSGRGVCNAVVLIHFSVDALQRQTCVSAGDSGDQLGPGADRPLPDLRPLQRLRLPAAGKLQELRGDHPQLWPNAICLSVCVSMTVYVCVVSCALFVVSFCALCVVRSVCVCACVCVCE